MEDMMMTPRESNRIWDEEMEALSARQADMSDAEVTAEIRRIAAACEETMTDILVAEYLRDVRRAPYPARQDATTPTISIEKFLAEVRRLGGAGGGAIDWLDEARRIGLGADDTAESLARLCVDDELSNLKPEADTEECAYCGAHVPSGAPPVADEAAWRQLARLHAADCEWVATRAHRRM